MIGKAHNNAHPAAAKSVAPFAAADGRRYISSLRIFMNNLCAICGDNLATTKDHIPPRGIYPKPMRHGINFNKIPACSSCNNGASIEDEEFKVFMGFMIGGFHKKPNKIIDSIAGTVGKNQKIANQIFRTKQNVYIQRKGSILEPAVSVTFDERKCKKVISRIIRGLYWMQKKEALGYNSKVNVFMPQNMPQDFIKSYMELMVNLPLFNLNEDTFRYRVAFDEKGQSFWGLQFFKEYVVFGHAEEKI